MFNTWENNLNSSMGQYSIKEVETLSGIKAHTLRIWEQRYNMLRPKRTGTNIRYYSDEQVRMILNIGTLNRHGLKISEIARMRPEQMREQVLKVQETTEEPDHLLDSLIHAMVDFDETRFEKTLSSAIIKLGFEKAFENLVFPFLIRCGVMWQAGSVWVAQEHFISNLIRRKICAAVDGITTPPLANSKSFVLFLPETETHEFLLLFSEYILRKNGYRVLYLGSSIPLNDIALVVKQFKPGYLLTYITVPFKKMTVAAYVKKLTDISSQCKLLFGGAQMNQLNLSKLPRNCRVIQSGGELLGAI